MPGKLNRNQSALVIKMAIVARGRSQTEVAQKLGLDRVFLNAFLNRRIDLLHKDVERLLDELDLQGAVVRLSVPVGKI